MTRTSQFLAWFSTQTNIVRCLTVAILLHAALITVLGTIKLAAAIRLPPKSDPFVGGIVDAEPTSVGAPPGQSGGGNGSQQPPQFTTLLQTGPKPPSATPPATSLAVPVFGIEDVGGRFVSDMSIAKVAQIPSTATPNFNTSGAGGLPRGVGNGFYSGRFEIRVGQSGETSRPTPESEGAVLAALRWLRDHQESDGSWRCPRSSHATSGLALLAFLAHGETADSKEFGVAVGRGLEFLVRSVDATGTVPGRNMYAQAIVTLALCEGYALTQSPVLREPAERAAQVLIAAQGVVKSSPLHAGGWRYTPTSADADTSVTGWTIMALQAAMHAGITVPSDTFTKAGEYLWRMRGKDGFGYSGPGDAPGTTAIATFCLQFLGQAGDSRLKGALDLLKRQKVSWEDTRGSFVLYNWYYTTLALYQGGADYWESWNKQIAHSMIEAQANDGSWPPPPQSSGEAAFASAPTYSTALGAMILETYYRYEPQYLSKKKKTG